MMIPVLILLLMLRCQNRREEFGLITKCNHECDLVGPNVVESDPDPSPPVIASEGNHYNHLQILLPHFNETSNILVLKNNDSGQDMII